jgi:hypothetical protein
VLLPIKTAPKELYQGLYFKNPKKPKKFPFLFFVRLRTNNGESNEEKSQRLLHNRKYEV